MSNQRFGGELNWKMLTLWEQTSSSELGNVDNDVCVEQKQCFPRWTTLLRLEIIHFLCFTWKILLKEKAVRGSRTSAASPITLRMRAQLSYDAYQKLPKEVAWNSRKMKKTKKKQTKKTPTNKQKKTKQGKNCYLVNWFHWIPKRISQASERVPAEFSEGWAKKKI